MTVGPNIITSWAADLFELEDQIEALQDAKKDLYKAIREEHGKKTANALKQAVKISRMDDEKRDEADEIDAETHRMLGIIETGTSLANMDDAHVARGAREQIVHGEDGEIIEPDSNSPEIPDSSTEPASAADPAGEGAGVALPADTQSTEAGTARRDNSTEGEPAPVVLDPEAATTPPASESTPVDTHSETPGAGAPAAAETVHTPISAAVLGSTPIVRISSKPIRPFCLHQDDLTKCGGYGKIHCHDCLKAHADAEGVSA